MAAPAVSLTYLLLERRIAASELGSLSHRPHHRVPSRCAARRCAKIGPRPNRAIFGRHENDEEAENRSRGPVIGLSRRSDAREKRPVRRAWTRGLRSVWRGPVKLRVPSALIARLEDIGLFRRSVTFALSAKSVSSGRDGYDLGCKAGLVIIDKDVSPRSRSNLNGRRLARLGGLG